METTVKIVCLPFDKGSALKGKNLLQRSKHFPFRVDLLGENAFLLGQNPFQMGLCVFRRAKRAQLFKANDVVS